MYVDQMKSKKDTCNMYSAIQKGIQKIRLLRFQKLMPTRLCLGAIYKQEAFHIFPHQVCLLKKSSLTILYHKRTEAQKVCIHFASGQRSFRFESNSAVSFCPFYNISMGDQSAVSVVQSPALSKTLLFSSNEECPKGSAPVK